MYHFCKYLELRYNRNVISLFYTHLFCVLSCWSFCAVSRAKLHLFILGSLHVVPILTGVLCGCLVRVSAFRFARETVGLDVRNKAPISQAGNAWLFDCFWCKSLYKQWYARLCVLFISSVSRAKHPLSPAFLLVGSVLIALPLVLSQIAIF